MEKAKLAARSKFLSHFEAGQVAASLTDFLSNQLQT
jgi:hypothetical protein